MAMERYELTESRSTSSTSAKHHYLCPEITALSAGGLELGTVACNCPCHKKLEIEVPQ
jgi:hypothetical protein